MHGPALDGPHDAVLRLRAAALRAQEVESDAVAAVVVQWHAGGEFGRQVERLDGLAARCQEGQS
jgi:hypothetical protein